MRKLLVGVTVAVILFVIVAAIVVRARQDKSKRPSLPATAKCELAAGKSVTIDYSSPRMKGRKIYGDLVPFGQVWRAGANEATTFVTSGDVFVGGKTVPAGSYTIFAIPTPDKWTLIINKKTGEWGIPYKYESDELARVDMMSRSCRRRWKISRSTSTSPETVARCRWIGIRRELPSILPLSSMSAGYPTGCRRNV